MESVATALSGGLRYVLPVIALIVILTCVVSLFRNRPRLHKMAQLVNLNDGSVTEITHWETSIGKSKANDISIPETGVSRFHAVLAKQRDGWTIVDTFSRVGVIVNGEQIEGRTYVEDGSVIKIGTVQFKLQFGEEILEKHVEKLPVKRKSNVAYAVLVSTKTNKPVYLRKNDVLIGRGENCDIRIVNNTVSSEQARIYKTTKGWALVDLDSHNGTKLNGKYISKAQLIFNDDVITFGGKSFVFYEQ